MQNQSLFKFPKARVPRSWFRQYNDKKHFHNDGTLQLFSLMALYSYANYRSDKKTVAGKSYLVSPGQWICKVSALPRIMRVHSEEEARILLRYFRDHGFLDFEVIDEEQEIIRYTLRDWRADGVFLPYNYYSYKGSGVFYFPLRKGRKLITSRKSCGGSVFSELDAIMDLWVHTAYRDTLVAGSEIMPVVYYADMNGKPLISYSYLAKRWGWSKSRTGRFILKMEAAGIISRISFTSNRGSILSPCQFRELVFGEKTGQVQVQLVGEILEISALFMGLNSPKDLEVSIQTCVPSRPEYVENGKALKIQVFRAVEASSFSRPVPLVFYSSLDWGGIGVESTDRRGKKNIKGEKASER